MVSNFDRKLAAAFTALSSAEGSSIVLHRSEVLMTQHDENCPTCGSQLGALNRVELRRCNACRRSVPAGFLYCGYCAAPMERTEIRARVAEVAAPPGGWPNLAGDLTEVKFFLKQGQLDEAYDLLSILQRRYPGHPELADFARSTESSPRPDADVEKLVDTVMADSSTLGGKIPRRRATPWDAPESEPTERRGRKLTTAHEVVRAALIEDVDVEDVAPSPVEKVVVAEYAKNPRPIRKPVPKVDRTHAFEAIPPKRMPRVRLRTPKGEMPTPKLLREGGPKAAARDQNAKARETAAKVRAAAAKVKAVAEQLPPLPEPNYAEKGRPATVHMPSVRAEDAPSLPPFEVKPDTSVPPLPKAAPQRGSLPKGDPPPKRTPAPVATPIPRAQAVSEAEPPPEASTAASVPEPAEANKGAAAPQRTMVVDALQPAAPYPEERPNRTIAVDALQPAAPFEGESDELFEARKEQIKRATSKTGRRRRVATGANKVNKRKRPRGVPPKHGEPDVSEEEVKKRRGTAFGAGVLSRFGR
ncbi:MAG: hypothetical protein ACRBN8_42980 [Nannocystales bacterium]